ncbi:MAG: methyltransferase domain-containing protein [Planctomycetes bacterium]|nr:methyltransferase domain-containing protein [Planctomycetota bacterium]MCB9883890.1 methyltransferase domain-containing protein [Planctomycetota bacterium]
MNLDEIRAAQEASWNRFSPGWRKWDHVTMEFLAPHGEAILAHLRPQGAITVLDVAAGTGEPGLSIARRLDGGRVVLTDLADGMLQVAKDKVATHGVTNVEFHHADACELPFADATFDAVSCRLGFMFFPDMAKAAAEMTRVLKPGGRFATTVWGPPDANFWVTCMMQNIGRHIAVPPPEPGAPGMFRCAPEGLVADLLRAAGLRDVVESEVPCRLKCSSPEGYWQMMTEVAAPFVAALRSADADTVARVRADVIAAVGARHADGTIDARGRAIVGVR